MPNFAMHAPDVDAPTPPHPHVACSDGFAWHSDPEQRPHWHGTTAATVERVAVILNADARPIDRILAVCAATETHPLILLSLFPTECAACGEGHRKQRETWARAARTIHPGAIEALKAASPPLYLLLDIDSFKRNRHDRRGRPSGLPLRETPAQTLAAQLAWAAEVSMRHEQGSRRARRGRIVVP